MRWKMIKMRKYNEEMEQWKKYHKWEYDEDEEKKMMKTTTTTTSVMMMLMVMK